MVEDAIIKIKHLAKARCFFTALSTALNCLIHLQKSDVKQRNSRQEVTCKNPI